MISDNYCNNTTWEIGLKEIESNIDLNEENEMVIRISPNKEGVSVDASSVMAGRSEVVDQEIAKVYNIILKEINSIRI